MRTWHRPRQGFYRKKRCPAAIVLLLTALLTPLAAFQSAAASPDQVETEVDEPDDAPQNESVSQDGVPLSDRIVDYHIEVTLAERERKLYGHETVTWRNPGQEPVHDLYIHLYPNAFESKWSSFMQEQGHLEDFPDTARGWMTVSAIRWWKDGRNLRDEAEFVQPDDENPNDRTLMKVPLLEEVGAGAAVLLDIDFQVQLPEIRRRMGMTGGFAMAGQWFPKLAVYEPAGMRGRGTEGWNLHQFHMNGEFYADFGTYDVSVHVPDRYRVAATGSLRHTEQRRGERVYRFQAADVHDFAWAASAAFVTVRQTVSLPHGRSIRLKLYMDEKSARYKDRYVKAAEKAMNRFGEWFGPYPYGAVSIVVPPETAAKAGGMEYPTLVTARAVSGEPDLTLERTVVHELAHQYWYGMVANNETEEAWLDEAFAVYAEDKVMTTEYDSPRARLPFGITKKVVQPSWLFISRFEYEDNVYYRGKMVLSLIEKQVGSERMSAIMRTYFERYRFKHPSTADFRRVVEEVTGQDWKPFFEEKLYGHPHVEHPVVQGVFYLLRNILHERSQFRHIFLSILSGSVKVRL